MGAKSTAAAVVVGALTGAFGAITALAPKSAEKPAAAAPATPRKGSPQPVLKAPYQCQDGQRVSDSRRCTPPEG
jgi:hypothetical protein